jgi:hypothetical protein
MKTIGFTLTKILAQKVNKKANLKPSTSIEFTDLTKDQASFLKEGEIIKINFKYSIVYEDESKKENPEPDISFEGEIILSVTKDESKEILKDWKKKKLPLSLNVSLFNLILKKCTPKAISLEDEINLPIHIPMPRLQPKKE